MRIRESAVADDARARGRLTLPALALILALALAGDALVPAVVAAKRGQASSEVNAEVVGGRPVAQGSLRFMTLVYVDTGRGRVQCGGSLIAPRYVLTAAHCVTDDAGAPFPPERLTLIIGRAVRSDSGKGVARGAVAVAPHPQYAPATSAYDLAVVTLDAAVPAEVATPLPIVGAGDTRFDRAGQPVVVAGWGRIVADGSTSDRLRAADLAVVGAASCNAAYAAFGGIMPAVMVCAAFRGRDSCQGDSGGPLFAREAIGFKEKKKAKTKGHKRKTVRVPIYRSVQMGIVSFGIGCADRGFPGVYTRLSNPAINAFIAAKIHP